MTDRNIKVGVEVDASSADQGLDKLANKAQSTSKIIKKAGEDAGQGFSKVGEGSEQASEKIDRTSKSIIQSIQRTTVALESGGRTTAKYYETIANQRGVSVDALRPYLEQLKAVETAQGKFTQSSGAAVNSLNNVGISAKQTAAAMRNVPAQFTDIVTSLQGGQAPLTVLLQQGGQLKDMFGGIGNAAGALGKYMLGLISPFTLLAGAAVAVGVAYNQGSKEAQEFNKSLVLTGNAAGTTTNQLMDMAKAISSSGASTQGAAAEALAALAGTGKVGVENLQRFASVAVQTQKIVGTSVQDTAKAFADLAKSPLESSLKLDEQYNFLTVSIYKQIKALQDQGNTIEAAKVAQNAYADALAERTAGIEQNLGSIERGWMNVTKFAKGAWDAMLGVGRDTTESDRIEQLQRNIANRADFISRERPQSLLIPKAQADNKKDQDELDLLLKKTEQKKIQGELDAKAIASKNAFIEFDRQGEKYLTSALKLENEIAKARKLGADAGLDEKQINDRVAAIRKEYAEKNKKTQQEETLASQVAFIERKKLRDAEKEMEKQFSDDIKQFSQEQVKRNKEVTDSLINQITRQDRAYFSIIEQQDAYRQSLQDNADLMQLEASLMGQSATDRNTAIEQYKIEIALQKELLKIKQDINLTDAQKTQLSESATENANIAKSQVALKVQQDEWSKFYQDIYNGLTDSLYRGFEAGKGFFQSFWDGIKNLFKTTVLKLAVQGVVTGTLGTLGISQAGAAQSSPLGNAVSLFEAGKSIWNGFSAAGTIGGGVVTLGNALGSSTLSAFGSGMSISSSQAASAAAAYNGAGMTGTGTAISAGSSAAAAIPIVGWVLAGMMANNSLFDKGWGEKLDDKAKYSGAAAGMVGGLFTDSIKNIFGLSDKTASMLSGSAVVNRLFGNKRAELQQSELSGSFGASGYTGSQRDVFKAEGGLFSGDKWSEKLNASSNTKEMSDMFMSIKSAAAGYASQLGLSSKELETFSKSFKFNLSITGDAAKDAEANQKLITDLFGTITNEISTLLAPSIANFAKEGETASQTLARLATGLSDVNLVMRSVGFAEFAKSLEGSNAAARLAELTGGIEKLATGAQFFFENFLTEAEKIKPSMDLVSSTMGKLGQSSVDTISEFKDLIQSLDLSSESGAKMYAELIAIAPQFKMVADYTRELTGALTEAEIAAKAAADAAKLEADTLSQRVALQDEYNQLTMTSAEILEMQRLAQFESNRTLFDSIQAVKAKQAADQEATREALEIAQERLGLQNELNELTLTETQLLDIKRNSYAAVNRDLFDQIQIEKQKALQEQQNAVMYEEMARAQAEQQAVIQRQQEDAARQAQDYARQMQEAANRVAQAWQGMVDNIYDEVRRIRGLGTGNTQQGFVNAQSDFAIATAQARSGDQKAYSLLPELSKAMLAIAEQQAPTLQALRLIQAQTAASLLETSKKLGFQLPSFDVGTEFVPYDMVAKVHHGERIVTAQDNQKSTDADNKSYKEMIDEVKMLKSVVSQVVIPILEIEKNSRSTRNMIASSTEDGSRLVGVAR